MLEIAKNSKYFCTLLNIERIFVCLTNFSMDCFRCRKLPKGLKEWPAYNDLKKKIDDFNETCPLLELMANKAMKERHWDRMAKATGHTFDFESDGFQLRNIMEAPILKFKDDIEVRNMEFVNCYSFCLEIYTKAPFVHIAGKGNKL